MKQSALSNTTQNNKLNMISILSKLLNNVKLHFFISLLLRLLLIYYGNKRDTECKLKNCVKYTDVDYSVFSDAAYYVYQVFIYR